MIEVYNIEAGGFAHAILGMRNSYGSWSLSDTGLKDLEKWDSLKIGKHDLELMRKLYRAGTSHRKYLRQIFVCMDIAAPLYWWKQMDTYKIGVTTNSTSTMHNIADKEFTLDDFSHEHLRRSTINALKTFIEAINAEREAYIGEGSPELKGDKQCWYSIIQLLPSSYIQLRTVTMNYENAVNIIQQRRGHKLDEWNTFCDILLDKLPYLKEIIE